MKVALDGTLCEFTRGLGVYVSELLPPLDKLNGKESIEITVFVFDSPKVKELERQFSLKFVKVPKVPTPIWEHFLFPIYAKRHKCNIVWHPYNVIGMFSCIFDLKVLVTIHDIMFMEFAYGNSVKLKLGNFYRKISSFFWRFSDATISVSDKTKNDLKLHYKIDSSFIPNSGGRLVNYNKEISMLSSYGVDDCSYILHVGGVGPNKNTIRVLKAFINCESDKKLVVLGGTKQQFLDYISKENSKLIPFLSNVVFPGFVDEETLANFYNYCEFVIFPSLQEGFGLPIVEARSLKKALITSDREPMSSLAGNASILVDPESDSDLKKAIDKLILNPLEQGVIDRSYEDYLDNFSEPSIRKKIKNVLLEVGK